MVTNRDMSVRHAGSATQGARHGCDESRLKFRATLGDKVLNVEKIARIQVF
jgi:hypothetical protein